MNNKKKCKKKKKHIHKKYDACVLLITHFNYVLCIKTISNMLEVIVVVVVVIMREALSCINKTHNCYTSEEMEIRSFMELSR